MKSLLVCGFGEVVVRRASALNKFRECGPRGTLYMQPNIGCYPIATLGPGEMKDVDIA